MQRWSAFGLACLAAAVLYLGSGTSAGRAAVGASISVLWAGFWLFFVTLHLSGLRDSEGHEKDRVGLPNGLTILRIVLIPAVCWAILAHPRLKEHATLTTILIFLVGFSDILDGLLARWLHWETILGRNIDHMADVLICASIALAEYLAGLMPAWLMGLIVFRYLGAGLGGTIAVALLPDVRISPSIVGRLCTLTVGATIFFTIAQPLVAPGRASLMVYLFGLAGAMIVINVAVLIVMVTRGNALERLRPTRQGSSPMAPDNGTSE